MPTAPDDELRKVTLNLYAADCAWLETHYGRGWTERIRQHIHSEVLARQKPIETRYHKVTLGDLAE